MNKFVRALLLHGFKFFGEIVPFVFSTSKVSLCISVLCSISTWSCSDSFYDNTSLFFWDQALQSKKILISIQHNYIRNVVKCFHFFLYPFFFTLVLNNFCLMKGYATLFPPKETVVNLHLMMFICSVFMYLYSEITRPTFSFKILMLKTISFSAPLYSPQ